MQDIGRFLELLQSFWFTLALAGSGLLLIGVVDLVIRIRMRRILKSRQDLQDAYVKSTTERLEPSRVAHQAAITAACIINLEFSYTEEAVQLADESLQELEAAVLALDPNEGDWFEEVGMFLSLRRWFESTTSSRGEA